MRKICAALSFEAPTSVGLPVYRDGAAAVPVGRPRGVVPVVGGVAVPPGRREQRLHSGIRIVTAHSQLVPS